MQKSRKTSGILGSTLKMATGTFTSRILGLVREQVMARFFGASGLTDAFLVAYRIPNILRDLFAEGAFSSAFVPNFTKALQEDKKKARALLWSLFWLLGGITLFCSGMIFVFSDNLALLFAPKFAENPEKLQLTINLIRIMSPFLFLISIAALFMGALNSLKVFFIPSLAPATFNVAMIVSMIFVTPVLIEKGISPAYSLGIGVFAGGFLQAMIQIPFLFKKGFAPTSVSKIWNKNTRKVLFLLGPGLVGFAATQVNVFVTTILATGTVVGAVSWLGYAFRLFQFPVGILSVSVAGSNLVHFSEEWKAKNKKEAKDILLSSYNLSWFLIMPALALMLAQADMIVHLIFEGGKFSRVDTNMTSLVLKYYLYGLPFYGLYKLFVPTFYAIGKQNIPVACSVVSVIGNIIFCILMVPKYGFSILALGTTLSMVANSMAQGIFLKKHLKLPLSFYLNNKVFKGLFAGSLLFLAVMNSKSFFYSLEGSFATKALGFGLGNLLYGAGYFLVLFIMGEGEFLRKLLKKGKKKK